MAFVAIVLVALAAPAASAASPLINGTFVPTTDDGATAQSTIGGLCIGCTVVNPGSAVSPQINAPARLLIPVGVLGSASVRVDLPAPEAGRSRFGAVITVPGGILDAGLLGRLTIRTLRDGAVVTESRGADGLLTVRALSRSRFALSAVSGGSFDAIEIEAAGVVGVLTEIDVLYTFVRRSNPPSVRIAQMSEGASLVATPFGGCVVCTLSDALRLVDSSLGTAATFRAETGLFGGLRVDVGYGEIMPAGSKAGFVLRVPGGLLDATLLSQMTIRTWLGGTEVASESGSGLRPAIYPDGRALVRFRSPGAFDAVSFELAGVALVLTEIELYAALAIVDFSVATVVSSDGVGDEVPELELAAIPADAAAVDASAVSAQVRLGAPSPNPVRGAARVSLTMDAPGVVRVVVLDALGREVAVVSDEFAEAGERSVELPVADLSPGMYTVRAIGAGGAAHQRFTVVR